MTDEKRQPRLPFQVNEFYEKLLRQRAADKWRFEISYSSALKLSVEVYAKVKRRAGVAAR